jgi:hypothetical protein
MQTKLRIAILCGLGLMALCASTLLLAQEASDPSHPIAGGGVFVPGWTGQIDASEAALGLVLANSKLSMEGATLHVATGPAATYWNPKNVATGDYTVKATFNELKYMNQSSHPHPYGIFIGGNDLGTPQATYFYCEAYGDGTFIARGFGPAAFRMNGRGASAPSIHKAPAVGSPVTQEIAMSVTPDAVSCTINGAVVASYPKTAIVGTGKLKSTDGTYGIRFAHNTEGTVTGFAISK